jgi:hypothetical protein
VNKTQTLKPFVCLFVVAKERKKERKEEGSREREKEKEGR